MHRYLIVVSLAVLALADPATVAAQTSVYLEELTWTEVRDAVKAGKTTVIFPTGGTEQNGPHMVLGKHNFIVRYTAGEIAKRLGNALVAPVLAYVPEGNLDPPSGHMRMAGTLTLPNELFTKVGEWAARGLRVHGFKDIVLIGDSGGNQAGLRAVAEPLNKEWSASPTRVHFIPDYYSGHGFSSRALSVGSLSLTAKGAERTDPADGRAEAVHEAPAVTLEDGRQPVRAVSCSDRMFTRSRSSQASRRHSAASRAPTSVVVQAVCK